MSTANPYDTIIRRNTVRRSRDVVFAVLLAVGAAFSIGSIKRAADRVAAAGAAPAAPATAPVHPQLAGACSLDATC